MIPTLSDIRYVGTQNFSVAVARAIVTSLNTAVTGVIRAGTVSAGYTSLVNNTKRFIKIMHVETDEELCLETVQALTKYWVKEAWGQDLLCDPATNAPMIWRVAQKDADYENREAILPAAQATLASAKFREFRPYGSIPGTWRLLEGTLYWWVTNNGTHGGAAACRAAPWWYWAKATCKWHKWNTAGGAREGAVVGMAPHAAGLAELSAHEKAAIKVMCSNATQGARDCGDELFASKTIWSDAEFVMTM